jgi:hypothetical protein
MIAAAMPAIHFVVSETDFSGLVVAAAAGAAGSFFRFRLMEAHGYRLWNAGWPSYRFGSVIACSFPASGGSYVGRNEGPWVIYN